MTSSWWPAPVAVFLVLLWAILVPLVDRPVLHPVPTFGAAVVTLALPSMADPWG